MGAIMKRVIHINEIEVKKKTKGPCLNEQPVATASKFLPEAEVVCHDALIYCLHEKYGK